MNGHQTKKMRQMMRKDYGRTLKEIAEINGQFLKTKPKWVPMFLWMAGLKIFVKIK